MEYHPNKPIHVVPLCGASKPWGFLYAGSLRWEDGMVRDR